MIDLAQIGMPTLVEADGEKWLAVYRVYGTGADERNDWYIAARGEAESGSALFLIAVPRPPRERAG